MEDIHHVVTRCPACQLGVEDIHHVVTRCPACQLGVEDIHHVVTRCPAYHDIQTLTASQLKNIIIDNSDICVWKTHFSNWDNLLRIIICPEVILAFPLATFSMA